MGIVREKVKPEREKSAGRNAIGKKRAQYWWRFDARAEDLYKSIASYEHAWASAETSKYFCLVKVPTDILFAHKVVVFADNSVAFFGLLNSIFHISWIETYASSLDTRIEYTIADGFETFPCPAMFNEVGASYAGSADGESLANVSSHFLGCREQITGSMKEGLTATYNRLHDPKDCTTGIDLLRQHYAKLNRAVATAYGWSDLDLGHGFHETKQGTRFTISESARRKVLARLLKLNHERYAEEVALGLHDKKKGKSSSTSRKSKGKASSEPSLFGEGDG